MVPVRARSRFSSTEPRLVPGVKPNRLDIGFASCAIRSSFESRSTTRTRRHICAAVGRASPFHRPGLRRNLSATRHRFTFRPAIPTSSHFAAAVKDHRLIDERSLAFHRRIVAKMRDDPSLMKKAHSNLQRWLQICSPGVRLALLEWQELLEAPFETLLAFLESPDKRATRLRQSSPCCGILTEEERMAIIREFYARESAAAITLRG